MSPKLCGQPRKIAAQTGGPWDVTTSYQIDTIGPGFAQPVIFNAAFWGAAGQKRRCDDADGGGGGGGGFGDDSS